MKRFEQIFPWVVVLLFAAWLAVQAVPPSDKPASMRIHGFGQLPVAFEGRVKPFDTLARNALVVISDRQDWTDDFGNDRPAVEWLLDAISGAPAVVQHKVFRIQNPQVLELLRLQPRLEPSGHRYRYSYTEIERNAEAFDVQVQRSSSLPPESRDALDNQVLELARKLDLFQRLQRSFADLSGDGQVTAENIELVRSNIQILEKKYVLVRAIPPGNGEDWQTFLNASASARVAEPSASFRAMSELLNGWLTHNTDAFNRSLDEYTGAIAAHPDLSHDKLRFETAFNHFQPFKNVAAIYLVAFVLGCLSWIGWTRPLNRAAFWLMVMAVLVHTCALASRIYISGYPPITNLYSTAIFIGWACVLFGLGIEAIFKIGIGNLVASIAGFTTLLIAHFLAGDGDTMIMMQAVLDTKFWLWTHVITINLGYAATFLAGLCGVLYILLGVFTTRLALPFSRGMVVASVLTGLAVAGVVGAVVMGVAAKKAKEAKEQVLEKIIANMIYGILNFALLFSFVGTVLGGLWADDSWGRFWGWDPKENGALMIVLWNGLILHARWGGLVAARGIAVLAVFGNIVTAWSWFGVNQLSVGLHSYGFTESAAYWLMLFVASQLLIIALGLLPRRFWRSSRAQNRTTPVTSG